MIETIIKLKSFQIAQFLNEVFLSVNYCDFEAYNQKYIIINSTLSMVWKYTNNFNEFSPLSFQNGTPTTMLM